MGFRARVAADVAALLSAPSPPVGPGQVAARMDSLPEPVRRYLRYAVPPGARAIRTVHLRHGGHFRTRPGQRWLPIEGEQYFTAGAPGFVWTARVRPAPLVWIAARDCLLGGRGHMLVKLNSVVTLADVRGGPTDQSAAVRWLMEVCWFPVAYAGDCIEWEPVDDRTARATLRESNAPASITVEVDEQGRLVSVAGDRYRDTGGGNAVLTPWIGLCGDYRDFDGLRVPSFIEGSWRLEGGDFTYVHFRVTDIRYS